MLPYVDKTNTTTIVTTIYYFKMYTIHTYTTFLNRSMPNVKNKMTIMVR